MQQLLGIETDCLLLTFVNLNTKIMARNIKDMEGENWEAYDNRRVKHDISGASSGSSLGLLFLLAIVVGMFLYVGSFYLDRKPMHEISRVQKSNESYFDLLPIPSFEKNSG